MWVFLIKTNHQLNPCTLFCTHFSAMRILFVVISAALVSTNPFPVPECGPFIRCPRGLECTPEGKCYTPPHELGEYCVTTEQCTVFEPWSECRRHQCKCRTGKIEMGNECVIDDSQAGPSIETIIFGYMLLPLVIISVAVAVIFCFKKK